MFIDVGGDILLPSETRKIIVSNAFIFQ